MKRFGYSKILVGGLVAVASVFITTAIPAEKASAACAALPTDRGTVTSTVSIPATGTYRVWSRIKTADTTKNSYYLQIDQTVCNVVVADGTIAANTWTWVDYQNGDSTSKVNATLTAGNHTVIMAGREDNVQVDRVIFTQDTACQPTGTGDNCANPPDTIAPTINITAPATNATINATTNVTVNASDDVAVTKIDFLVDGTLKSSGTATSFSFDPTLYTIGTHALTAKAYDAAGHVTTSGVVNVIVPDKAAPTAVTLTAPTAGATVSGTITLSGTASDNVAVTKMDFFVDGGTTAIGTDSQAPFSASYTTTGLTNGTHTFTAKAYDAAGNSASSAAVSVTVSNTACTSDTTAPTVSISHPTAAEVISGTAYSVTANATDAVCGVKQVTFYIDGAAKTADTTSPFTYTLDTTTLANGNHTFYAVAIDNATTPNSATSATITASVNNFVYIVQDINKDKFVNLQDFSLLAADFGNAGSAIKVPRTDINGSGVVDIGDFSSLKTKIRFDGVGY